ncbi:MAG: DUF560 domain-containing protein [Alphaproteobacteria bacterium]|nr:DUF560 domain-containing protein [Alphaproteobacteria bacterium]
MLKPGFIKLQFGRNVSCALLALVAATGLFAAAPALADPPMNQQEYDKFSASDENQRVHILIKLAQAGFADTAEMLLRKFPLQGPNAANRTLFIEGLILEKRGHLSDAAAKFRTALGNDPRLTLVRIELAQVLARLDDTDAAKHHLRLLEAEAQDAQQAAGIRSFIDSLDAHHPLTFSGFISLAPSTNINQGSSHSTMCSPGVAGVLGVGCTGDIAPSSQKTSGIGIMGGANIGYRRHIGDHFEAVLAGGATGAIYPSINATSLGFSQSAELRYDLPDGYVGFGGVGTQAMDPVQVSMSYNSYGPRVSFAKLISPQNQLSGSALYEWRHYPQSPTSEGTALQITAVLTHAIDQTANVALITGYENVNQQLSFNSYQDATIGFGFYKELSHGFTVQGQATARFAGFKDINPFQAYARMDQNYTGSITLTKRDWNWVGFAPSLNYTYTRNVSNMALYDFDSHSLDFRLTKEF